MKLLTTKYISLPKRLFLVTMVTFALLITATLLTATTKFKPILPTFAQATCPNYTSDYGSSTKCATTCESTCTGPDNRCCPTINIPKGGRPVTKETLDSFNPLQQFSNVGDELSTPGGILSRFFKSYAFALAGLILFAMLIWGGFEMMTGAANKKAIDAGKQRINAALIGFLLLFASFWIAQILEVVFGIKIL
jgi:hypothetical protein